MGSDGRCVHILFFPFMPSGHMIPMLDMAKLFARRGAKVTVATTQANADLVHAAIDRANLSNPHPIELVLLPFPAAAAGLPDGCDRNVALLSNTELRHKFFLSLPLLRPSFERALRDLLPDCLVSDAFLPFTLDAAAELAIPRLAFYGTSFFSHCALDIMHHSNPLAALPSDADSFVLPGLPHRVKMLRSQVHEPSRVAPDFQNFLSEMREAGGKSYGTVVNSFYELEPDYVEHYRSVLGRRAWAVGPVSLCNKDVGDKAARGDTDPAVGKDECLAWLDSKKPGSVVYVSFGSLGKVSAAQLPEIALGLEAAGHPFIWVVKGQSGGGGEEWMPEGFEERNEGKGLVIRGWAPQILILGHAAVGGFVTHCGWNSSLEGVAAGVPMVTWPMFAEQFYNEKLLVEVVGVGVGVGVKKYTFDPAEAQLVTAAEVEAAVGRLMGGGEEAEGRRRRARELAEMAARAVEEGGSSYGDIGDLITEMLERRSMVGGAGEPPVE